MCQLLTKNTYNTLWIILTKESKRERQRKGQWKEDTDTDEETGLERERWETGTLREAEREREWGREIEREGEREREGESKLNKKETTKDTNKGRKENGSVKWWNNEKKQKSIKLESRRRLKNRNVNKSIKMNIQKIHF